MLDLESEELVAALNVENEYNMIMDEDSDTIIERASLSETQEDQPNQTVSDEAKGSLFPAFELLLSIIRKFYLFVGCLIIVLILVALFLLLPQKIFLCMLALMTTAWGLLLIAQACNPRTKLVQGILNGVIMLGVVSHSTIGYVLLIPIVFLAWLANLFSQAFTRGRQISRSLGGQRNH